MGSRGGPDLVSVLEAAYAVDRPEREWLQGLIDAIRPSVDAGLGIAAYVYDTNDRPFRVKNLLVEGCPVDEAGIAMLNHESNDSFVRDSWIARAAMMASETPGYANLPGVRGVLHPAGIRDIMVVNAIDPIGVGCWIGAPLPQLSTLAGTERERWDRVAAHLRSSLRLRLRLAARETSAKEGGPAEAEAILTPAGKIEHLERAAEPERDALHDAALGIVRARTEYRDEPERSLVSWKAMVRARWTLVDEFRKDGERYIVARVNAMATKPMSRLSERERQVVACLSMGQTNKEAAYELGLSPSTVRVLVARAFAKLGVDTRDALVAKYRQDTLM
ncbi:MAG: LuxR family transcriptional regulator [Labilithrix sp.]|nr:LuxR family transcriptional regulator [Labilithrix sp.]MBX3220645.1 LuxR family transcriptional regulator [Labilithrix sp.]